MHKEIRNTGEIEQGILTSRRLECHESPINELKENGLPFED